MAMFTTTTDVSGILPDDYGALIVQPVARQSIALQVSTVIGTDSHTFRQPILTEDANAAWYGEGQEITADDPTLAEIETTPSKVAGLTIISNELADDSSPEAAELVGNSIARSIARRVDEAYFGDLAAPAPSGLESLTTATEVPAGTAWENTDPFADAIAYADLEGSTITNFVANPVDYRTLMKLKRQADSNEPLFGLDATSGTRRLILGVPMLASEYVEPGTIWGIAREFSHVIMRRNVTIETSRDVKFTSDQTVVKSTMRVGFAFPHPKALVKIVLGV